MADGTVGWMELEKNIARELGNPDSTVSYLVRGVPDTVAAIKSHIQAGTADRVVKAKQMYDDLVGTLGDPDNLETQASILNMTARSQGTEAKALHEAASYASSNAFNKDTVELPDGRTTTLREFFMNPDFNGNPGEGKIKEGFDEDVVQAWLGADSSPYLRRSLGYYIGSKDESVSSHAPAATRAIYRYWDDISSVCRDGAELFCRRMSEFCGDVDGYERMIPGLLNCVAARESKDLSGAQLVSTVLNDLSGFCSYAARDDASDGTAGKRIDKRNRRLLNATAIQVMADMYASDGSLELNTVPRRDAMARCLSYAARMEAIGAGVEPIADAAGTKISKLMAEYVANAGTPAASNCALFSVLGDGVVPGYRQLMDRTLTGGDDFRPDNPSPSASQADWTRMTRSVGGTSSFPEADLLRTSVEDVVERYLGPHLNQGYQPSQAWDKLMGDFRRSGRFMDDVTSVVRTFVPNEAAASAVAGRCVEALRSGSATSVARIARDLEKEFSETDKEAGASLARWVKAGTSTKARYADEYAKLLVHAQDPNGLGMSERDAVLFASGVLYDAQAADDRIAGWNPDDGPSPAAREFSGAAVFRNAMRKGWYYDDNVFVTDKDGKQVGPMIAPRSTDDLPNVKAERPELFVPGRQREVHNDYKRQQEFHEYGSRLRTAAEIKGKNKGGASDDFYTGPSDR